MSLHDAYARTTPFELAFPDVEAIDRLADDVAEEARGRGSDPGNPHVFLTLGSVGAFVAAIQGPDAAPRAVHPYAALAYHAVHFRRAGEPLFVLSTHAARYLVEGTPTGGPELPARAGYLQLPQHLFWTAAGDDAVPESIDGLFWTVSPSDLLHVLAVTGVRADGPGFGTIPLPEAPLAEATAWMEVSVRRDHPDFSSRLPGAELDGLYAVESAGELLKLLARVFAHMASVPRALGASDRGPADAHPRASALPFRRVTLDG